MLGAINYINILIISFFYRLTALIKHEHSNFTYLVPYEGENMIHPNMTISL